MHGAFGYSSITTKKNDTMKPEKMKRNAIKMIRGTITLPFHKRVECLLVFDLEKGDQRGMYLRFSYAKCGEKNGQGEIIFFS